MVSSTTILPDVTAHGGTSDKTTARTVKSFDAIPAAIKGERWVCWNYERRDAAWTKVPKNPATGRNASSTDLGTAGNYEEARRAYEQGRFNGVGILLHAGSKLAGADIDHQYSPQTGMEPYAAALVARGHSYTEVSPGGDGLRILMYTDKPLPKNTSNNPIGVEVYHLDRFPTITGNRLSGTPTDVAHRTEELAAIYKMVTSDIAAVKKYLNDKTNGDKHKRLWNGDFRIDFPDSTPDGNHSAADASFILSMLYKCQGDTEQVDRLMLRSGLYRTKWTETRGADTEGNPQTYGQRTLQAALVSYEATQAQNIISAGPFHMTDAGNAERLKASHKDKLRYATDAGWLAYDGTRWLRDDTAPRRAARAVATALRMEAAIKGKAERAQHERFANASEATKAQDAMIKQAKEDAELRASLDDFDTDANVLNTPSGLVDLRTGALTAHEPSQMVTKMTAAPYDLQAECPHWLAFLDKIFAGNQGLTDYIQSYAGYSLTGSVSERAFAILHGRGANGKTTFIETISELMGDYAAKSRVETFMTKRGGGVPNDVAALKGARFVYTAESEAGMKLSEGLVKELTGGDKIQARFMRQDFFTFMPECKLWVATNHKPEIRGTDDGIWTRVKLVPFNIQIPESEQISRDEMLARFRGESAGILAWMVKGAMGWYANGRKLITPPEVREATQDYRDESDVLGDFFDSYCTLGSGLRVEAHLLYQTYANWAGENGLHTWSLAEFGKQLSARGLEKQKTNGDYYRKGLKLK